MCGMRSNMIPERGSTYRFFVRAWPNEPWDDAVRLYGKPDAKYDTFLVVQPNGIQAVGGDGSEL